MDISVKGNIILSEDKRNIMFENVTMPISSYEVVLNREWIYDNPDDDPTHERNFIVPYDFAKQVYEQKLKSQNSNDDFELFLEYYVPEEDGEFIYQEAARQGQLIKEGIDLE